MGDGGNRIRRGEEMGMEVRDCEEGSSAMEAIYRVTQPPYELYDVCRRLKYRL